MLKKLILVRHGETDLNKQGILQGQADTPLNSNGKHQAKLVADVLRNETFDAIWASPLQRALHTAQVINQHHNKNIQLNHQIIERNFGEFEGKPVKDLFTYEPTSKTSLYENTFGHGESLQQLFARAEQVATQIKQSTAETLLMVSHAGFCRPLLGALLALEFEQWFSLPQHNVCLNTLVFDDQGKVVAHQLNEHGHLALA